MVSLPAAMRKGKKLYKGYFNYRILGTDGFILKTYNFMGYPKSLVNKLREQFQNPKIYHFFGEKVVRAKEPEKLDKEEKI